jgi:hypothetical protein
MWLEERYEAHIEEKVCRSKAWRVNRGRFPLLVLRNLSLGLLASAFTTLGALFHN